MNYKTQVKEYKIKKTNLFLLFALIGIIVNCVSCAPGTRVTLVKDGKPLAGIVIDAEKPTRSAQMAAYELQHVIKLITGAELPLTNKVEDVKGVSILVGESDATRKLKIPDPAFKGEEYLVKFAGNQIVLMGNDTPDYGKVDYADLKTFPALEYNYRSTTYAVYDFLEKCCGVRFYSYGDEGTAFEKRPTLTVQPVSIRYSPKMDAYRHPCIGGTWASQLPPRDVHLLQLRWRVNTIFGTSNHSIYSIFWRYWGPAVGSYSNLFIEKRPEYFAQATPGSRNALSQWSYPNQDIPPQVCPSHPGVVDYFAEEAFKVYQGERIEGGYGNYALNQLPGKPWFYPIVEEDNTSWCKCDKCKNSFTNVAPERRYNYIHFDWVNRIAEAAVKRNPAIGISTLAYNDHLPYPDPSVLKLQPNVAVQMCLGVQSWFHPGVYAWQHKAYKDWVTNEVANRPLFVWAYMLCPAWDARRIYKYNQFFPVLYPWQAGRIFKEFAQDGIRGYYAQAAETDSDVNFHLLELYVANKVCFDPAVDTDQLIDEYFTLYYGQAGEPMRRFYRTIEDITWNPTNYPAKLDGYGWGNGRFPHWSFTCGLHTEKVNWHLGTPERMAELQKIIDQAEKQAVTPMEKQRVKWFIDNIWAQAVVGRKAFDERNRIRALPWPSLVVADYAGECDSAPDKVDFNEAAKSGGWAMVDGHELLQKPELSFASDSKYLYLKFHETGDKALKHQNAGLLTNNIEIFLAARPDYPYGQMVIAPNGEFKAVRHLGGGVQTNEWPVKPVIKNQLDTNGWTLTMAIPLEQLLPDRAVTPGSMIYANFIRTRIFDGVDTSWSWSPLYMEGYAERLYRSLGRIFIAPLAPEGDLPVNGDFKSASGTLPDGWVKNGTNGTITLDNGRVKIVSAGGWGYLGFNPKMMFPARRGDRIVFEFTARGEGKGAVGAFYGYSTGSGGPGSTGQRLDNFKVTGEPQKYKIVLPVVNLPYPRLFTAGFQPMLAAAPDSQVEYSQLKVYVIPRGK